MVEIPRQTQKNFKSMKALDKPAKRIFSRNKDDDEKFGKTHKSVLEKTLALISNENGGPSVSVNKRKAVDSGEKSDKKKTKLQTTNKNSETTSKSESSDKKRLESLKKWQRQLDQQKSTLKKALSKDNESINKKVVFDDEELENTSDDGIDKSSTHHDVISQAEKPVALFDESSSDESDNEAKDIERFRFKTEFEGKSGKKLKELQKKYGNDERFKLSEKFLDKAETSDEESKSNISDNEDDDTIKDDEIRNSLKIADQVLQNNDIRIKSKTNKKFKDVSALRLDPEKIIHQDLIKSPNKKPKKKSVTLETISKTEEIPTVPKVEKKSYYEVETSLKDAFTTSTEQPFSILASFGDPNVPIKSETSSDEEAEETVMEKSHLNENECINETEKDPLIDIGTPSVMSDDDAAPCTDKTFFFMANDKRLTEGVKNFHRTDEEEMWKQWKRQHHKIKSLFHGRQKHIVRRLNYKKSAAYKKPGHRK